MNISDHSPAWWEMPSEHTKVEAQSPQQEHQDNFFDMLDDPQAGNFTRYAAPPHMGQRREPSFDHLDPAQLQLQPDPFGYHAAHAHQDFANARLHEQSPHQAQGHVLSPQSEFGLAQTSPHPHHSDTGGLIPFRDTRQQTRQIRQQGRRTRRMATSPEIAAGLTGTSSLANGSTSSSPTATRFDNDGLKRNRSVAELDSSPGSNGLIEDDVDGHDDKRRAPGVKRACNECRQQKLKCNVQQDPFVACERCTKLKLGCRIDSNFKRVGKRNKNAEMERELMELRALVDSYKNAGYPTPSSSAIPNSSSSVLYTGLPQQYDGYDNSHEGAVRGLVGLRHGDSQGLKALESVILAPERVQQLFNNYFANYHPFLPVLTADKDPNYYYELSPVLFWTVVCTAARHFPEDPSLLKNLTAPFTRLIWQTISAVPQNYHVVKALCLLCTWPLPTSSTSTDPTFMFCGLMMQIALQMGLHRPSHAQDFSRFHVELREEDIRDRIRTWSCCNIVAQSVSTAYGQPPITNYDWTLDGDSNFAEENYPLPTEFRNSLEIEKFSNLVTKELYTNKDDPVGVPTEKKRASNNMLLAHLYRKLEQSLDKPLTPIDQIYLRAAGLHRHLSVFFASSTSSNYERDLLDLYEATTDFINCVLELEPATGLSLSYGTQYIMLMILASGFALLRLLNSFFSATVNLEEGRRLFARTVEIVRRMSVTNNDLPQRLAEVLAQLWQHSRAAGLASHHNGNGYKRSSAGLVNGVDTSLELKVRCRMSMSLVYDSVWIWREQLQGKGRHGNLDNAVNNPTNPEATVTSSSAQSVTGNDTDNDQALSNMHGLPQVPNAMSGLAFNGANLTGTGIGMGDEVFDPLNWVLDGFLNLPNDFPNTTTNSLYGLDAQGLLN